MKSSRLRTSDFLESKLGLFIGSKHRQAGLHARFELLKVNFSVTIHVKPSQDSHELGFSSHVTARPQKPLEVCLIQIVIVPIVNSLEGFLESEIVCVLKVPFQLVHLQVVPHLLKYQLAQSPLNSHRQELAPRDLIVRPLGRRSSQISVITRQQYLYEVMIVQLLVVVQVEVSNQLVEIGRF